MTLIAFIRTSTNIHKLIAKATGADGKKAGAQAGGAPGADAKKAAAPATVRWNSQFDIY